MNGDFVLVMKSLSLARLQPRDIVAPGRIGYILSAKLKRTTIGGATNNSIITANDSMASAFVCDLASMGQIY